MSQTFEIVLVCTGNICRSPLAEQLLWARLQEAGEHTIVASSAGLYAVVGAPMDPISASVSRARGGTPTPAAARMFTEQIAKNAGLILTMTIAQRDELIARYPRMMQRTFTLAEFASLLQLADPTPHPELRRAEYLKKIVRNAASRRSLVTLSTTDDVVDPIGREPAVHEAVGEHLDRETRRIVAGLR